MRLWLLPTRTWTSGLCSSLVRLWVRILVVSNSIVAQKSSLANFASGQLPASGLRPGKRAFSSSSQMYQP